MTPPLLKPQRTMMTMVLLISCLAVTEVASFHTSPRVNAIEHIEEACPPCELLFSKLERTGKDGKLSQDVRVQERGEPKSGTGVLYFWATAALMRACDYLEELFGEGSCRFDHIDGLHNVEEGLDRYPVQRIVFEPSLGGSDARCSCESIDRVSTTTSSYLKHMLPVIRETCAFSHGGGAGVGRQQTKGKPRPPPCTFPDGSHVTNHDELWQCMHEADCDITDDWTQMAVFRDPRPAVVSTFYHAEVHGGRDLGDMEAFVARELPILCQWLAVRYILFTGFLGEQSLEFWYNDAIMDPLDWHYQWLYSIGLQLPFNFVQAMAQAAAADDLGFNHKKIDQHPGEEKKTEPGSRRFENEVSPETLELADDILRTWLPPVLLERFGVLP